jgi:5'-deoxynucleotidase YfbR-like HD superfamily hydrolase
MFDNETLVRAMEMAMVHGLGETVIGDIAPSDGIRSGKLSFPLNETI